jgi:hypothetical protein
MSMTTRYQAGTTGLCNDVASTASNQEGSSQFDVVNPPDRDLDYTRVSWSNLTCLKAAG